MVDHAVVVRVGKCVADLGDYVDRLAGRPSALPPQHCAGVVPVDELHDDEVLGFDPGVQAATRFG